MRTVFSTVVLVMPCMKLTHFKMLRRLSHCRKKKYILFLNVTVNFVASQEWFCYWFKHVPGIFSVKDTIFSISYQNPNLGDL